jgi:hypothetical protein
VGRTGWDWPGTEARTGLLELDRIQVAEAYRRHFALVVALGCTSGRSVVASPAGWRASLVLQAQQDSDIHRRSACLASLGDLLAS